MSEDGSYGTTAITRKQWEALDPANAEMALWLLNVEAGVCSAEEAEWHLSQMGLIRAIAIRDTVVGLIANLAHARKYMWAEQPDVAKLLTLLDGLVGKLAAELPENQAAG